MKHVVIRDWAAYGGLYSTLLDSVWSTWGNELTYVRGFTCMKTLYWPANETALVRMQCLLLKDLLAKSVQHKPYS